MMNPLLINKEHAKVGAGADGVIAVWTHRADSLREFVECVQAMVDAVGSFCRIFDKARAGHADAMR